jgi:hypothetical protein
VAEQLRENLLNCYKALWRVRLKDMRERLRQQDVVEAIALHMFCANLRVKKIAIEILISLCQTRNDHRCGPSFTTDSTRTTDTDARGVLVCWFTDRFCRRLRRCKRRWATSEDS